MLGALTSFGSKRYDQEMTRENLRRRLRRGARRATMSEVATAAGVSTSTVSLFLRRPGAVSAPLSRRVHDAIDRLGYVPNRMAGALASARSRVIGVIVPSMVNSFFAGTVEALEAVVAPQGYQLLLGNSQYDEDREEAIARAFLAWSPAAMVVTGLRHTRATARLLIGADVPVVEVWEMGESPLDMLVGFSHHKAGRTMADHHYISGGRKRVAFIGAMLDRDRRAGARRKGYAAAVSARGAHEEMVLELPGRASTEAGAAAIVEVRRRWPEVDAVCCSNDTLALGVLFECSRRGWRVPGVIAVSGFGDLEFAAQTNPALTTIRPPREEIGRVAGEILLARFAGSSPRPLIHDLAFELIARASG